MPRRQTETSKIAKELGATYAFVKHRLENGIPLDAPRMVNNNPKAWKTRKADAVVETPPPPPLPRPAPPPKPVSFVPFIPAYSPREARNPLAVMVAGNGR